MNSNFETYNTFCYQFECYLIIIIEKKNHAKIPSKCNSDSEVEITFKDYFRIPFS